MKLHLDGDLFTMIPPEKLDELKTLTKGWFSEPKKRFNNEYQSQVLDLYAIKEPWLEAMIDLFESLKSRKAIVRQPLSVLRVYRDMMQTQQKEASSCETMTMLLKRYITMEAPRQRLYTRVNGLLFSYYVDAIVYHPEERTREGHLIPAKMTLYLVCSCLGARKNKLINFDTKACCKAPEKLLTDNELMIETDELREEYAASIARYQEISGKVGLECRLVGTAFSIDDSWRYASRRDTTVQLYVDRNYLASAPGRVVVDIYAKDDDSEDVNEDYDFTKTFHVDSFQWLVEQARILKSKANFKNKKLKATVADWKRKLMEFNIEELEEMDRDAWYHYFLEELKMSIEELTTVTLPIHPLIPFYDLDRHNRSLCHIDSLEVHQYDKDLDQRLVVDEDVKLLVRMLADKSKTTYKDIVGGKSGGTHVLLTGRPGLGKTLTAEIFSEVVERPLYRVHCSQLGTSPDTLETELQKVFQRALRWNAIVLLDEADVYIRERGADINTNAIIGVFLRLLEYYDVTIFFTTNLPESVDDAIASRCIARIDYTTPSAEQLEKLWTVLSSTANIDLSNKLIKQLVAQFPGLSGRDVKNTLKLVSASKTGKAPTFEDFARTIRFHPNRGNWS